MADASRPSVIVFDVNETLLDIETLDPLFVRLFGDRRTMRDWYAQLVLYSEALTLAGSYSPFADLGGAVLRMLGEIRGVSVQDDDVAELRNLTLGMPAHDDVPPALARLEAAGFRLVTLTNSAPDPTASPLERTGLAALLERPVQRRHGPPVQAGAGDLPLRRGGARSAHVGLVHGGGP